MRGNGWGKYIYFFDEFRVLCTIMGINIEIFSGHVKALLGKGGWDFFLRRSVNLRQTAGLPHFSHFSSSLAKISL